jgi:hypothetical protein
MAKWDVVATSKKIGGAGFTNPRVMKMSAFQMAF